MTYQPDSTDIQSVKSETMVLYVGDNVSRFSSVNKAVGDSLKNNWKANPVDFAGLMAKIPKTDFLYHIYKGIPKGKISFTQQIIPDKFLYSEEIILDWKITSETKRIAGYNCQKATTTYAGRFYNAWFTTEIPISDGPYKFSGLPGLIVNISDLKEHYKFRLVGMEKLENPVPIKINIQDYFLTSKANFLNTEKQFQQDPVAYAERTPGFTVTFPNPGDREKNKRDKQEKLRKKNNPIELE